MPAPRVSVCIPAYKQPSLLRRALESVAVQDLAGIETIVTDDSPDGDVERVVRDFEGRLPVDYSRNVAALGSPRNWDAAIARATAPLVKLLHHDDWLARPDSLRVQAEALEACPSAVLAFSGTNECRADGTPISFHAATPKQADALARRPAVLLAANFIGAPSATMFRRDAGLEFDPRLKWLVDIDFYVRLLGRGGAGRFVWTADRLVNIMAESDDRVTASCRGNPKVELFEFSYLYGKLVAHGLAGADERRVAINILHRYHDPAADTLIGYGVESELARSLAREAGRTRWPRKIWRGLKGVRERLGG